MQNVLPLLPEEMVNWKDLQGSGLGLARVYGLRVLEGFPKFDVRCVLLVGYILDYGLCFKLLHFGKSN